MTEAHAAEHPLRSAATTLISAQAGLRLGGRASVVLDVFNLFDA